MEPALGIIGIIICAVGLGFIYMEFIVLTIDHIMNNYLGSISVLSNEIQEELVRNKIYIDGEIIFSEVKTEEMN